MRLGSFYGMQSSDGVSYGNIQSVFLPLIGEWNASCIAYEIGFDVIKVCAINTYDDVSFISSLVFVKSSGRRDVIVRPVGDDILDLIGGCVENKICKGLYRIIDGIFGIFIGDLHLLTPAAYYADHLIQALLQLSQLLLGVQSVVVGGVGGGVDVVALSGLGAVLKGHSGNEMSHTVVLFGVVIGVDRYGASLYKVGQHFILKITITP